MGEQRFKQRGSLSVVRGNATTQNVTYGSEANAMETRFAEGQHRIDCRIFAKKQKSDVKASLKDTGKTTVHSV